MRNDIALLPELITPSIALSLIPAFTSAYAMATETANSTDFLGWDLKPQILPHLKNWAIEYELKRRSDEGVIPFSCSVAHNQRRNHKHIELRNGKLILTVSQVQKPTAVPRESFFRNELCLDGQTVLESFSQNRNDSGNSEIYAILTHGWQTETPLFINCGIPSPDMSCWAQFINLLNIIPSLTIVDNSPPTEDIRLEFREHAIKLAIEE